MRCRLDDDDVICIIVYLCSKNKQYLRHSGKEFEGSSDRSDYRTFIKCVVHRRQSLVIIFPYCRSCRKSITTEWQKFSGTMNVHASGTTMIFNAAVGNDMRLGLEFLLLMSHLDGNLKMKTSLSTC